jgi:acetyl-CoA C-acetyltransferase
LSKVHIVSAKRTAIGSFLGSLSAMNASDLGAVVLRTILDETKVNPAEVDEVIVGHVLTAGQGQGTGRQVAIKAGLPDTVCGYGINMVCGSGLKSVMNGYASIQTGLADLIIAGGVENMSQAPFITPKTVRSGHKMGNVVMKDHMVYDALTDAYDGIHMGVTAENIASQYELSREKQDAFAYNSQMKAIKAIESGRFKNEIVPVEMTTGKATIIFDQDEYPNRTTSLEKLAKLKTVFKNEGTVTAGNSSGVNDGASFVMLASEDALNTHHLESLCEIVGIGQGGVNPLIMGMGPVEAIRMALKNADMRLEDIELFELNEAFAAQSLGVITELCKQHSVSEEWLIERTNVNGGAIALGHPVGASGNRILVSLIHEMKKRKLTYGAAALCIGGGMGTAIIVKM